jgi:uncharacterized protein (UPF0332 family)
MRKSLSISFCKMDKIRWCSKKGLRMIEPNPNLSEAYVKKAEEALESMGVIIIKDWRISTAYYTMYFSLYSLLMRIGIRCEIHSCTLEFARRYLKEYFVYDEIDFIEESLKSRIDSQYYVDRSVPDAHNSEMIKRAPELLVLCKSILIRLNEKKIEAIRSEYESNLRQEIV